MPRVNRKHEPCVQYHGYALFQTQIKSQTSLWWHGISICSQRWVFKRQDDWWLDFPNLCACIAVDNGARGASMKKKLGAKASIFICVSHGVLEYFLLKRLAGFLVLRVRGLSLDFSSSSFGNLICLNDCMTAMRHTKDSPYQVLLQSEQFQKNCYFYCGCDLRRIDYHYNLFERHVSRWNLICSYFAILVGLGISESISLSVERVPFLR